MQHQKPADAPRMHRRLKDLGIVRRAQQALESDRTTLTVTDLVCWVVLDRGECKVICHYKRRAAPTRPGGKPGRVEREEAEFAVSTSRPFGTIAEGYPLMPRQVTDIKAILESEV